MPGGAKLAFGQNAAAVKAKKRMFVKVAHGAHTHRRSDHYNRITTPLAFSEIGITYFQVFHPAEIRGDLRPFCCFFAVATKLVHARMIEIEWVERCRRTPQDFS